MTKTTKYLLYGLAVAGAVYIAKRVFGGSDSASSSGGGIFSFITGDKGGSGYIPQEPVKPVAYYRPKVAAKVDPVQTQLTRNQNIARGFVGMTQANAVKMAAISGMIPQVCDMQKNPMGCVTTATLNPQRVVLSVSNDKVIGAKVG
jgi:hypothetical protein